MKNCSKCGRQIDDQDVRCPDCGAQLDGSAEQPLPQAHARSVKIRTFSTEMEAQMASAFLEGVGINALILADDCGGLLQPLVAAKGFRLMVSDDDLSRAEVSLREYDERTHTPAGASDSVAGTHEGGPRGE